MSKIVIKNTPSGPIELHFNGNQLVMQYNCNCLDALPICHAACCRYRPFYNVSPEESGKYKTEEHPDDHKLLVLQHVDGHCIHLDNNSLCEVHEDKPCICKKWHCSPYGGGPDIEQRDGGWVLLPLKNEKPS